MKDAENQMKEMIDLIKSIQTSLINGESHLKDLQESVVFMNAKFDEYGKDKKEKEEKNKFIRKYYNGGNQ